MTTTPEYDAILARKMAESAAKSTGCDTLYPAKGHTHTQLTEAETQSEILRIQDGAKSSFEDKVDMSEMVTTITINIPKRRGRPPGSKNKPKTDAKT